MLVVMKSFCRLSIFVALAGLLSIASAAQENNSSSMGSSSNQASASQTPSSISLADRKFMREAASGGKAEVELGQLALQKASSDDVKKFGQRMVDDHSKANDQLKQIAASEGVNLPSGLNAKDEATKDRLSKLSGEQFDKAYMADMLKDHKNDIAAFQKEKSTGHDPQVKDFAAQTLPTLRDHLKEAESIAPKVLQARDTMQHPNNSQQ
jgi:putative membrane protein